MIKAFRNKQFRLFFLGAFFSVQAIWIQRVTLSWLAWEMSNSAGIVGLVAALSLAPSLIGGPIFGVIADRVDIRRAAQLTNGAMMLCLTMLALAMPWIGLAGLVVGAIVIGAISSAHHPVRMSLGPRLVPPDLVAYVVSLQALNFNVARLVAPALTGIMIASVGARVSLWVAVAFFLPMFLVLFRLSPRALPPRPRQSFLRDMREGVVHAARDPQIRLAFLLTLVFSTLVRGALEVLPVLADGTFERGAAGLGVLTGAVGAGAIVTAGLRAFGAGRITDRVPVSVKLACAIALAAVMGMGAVHLWIPLLMVTAIAGGAATWCGVSLQATIQTGLPDELRGRVMSLWIVLGFGMAAIGALAIGGVAELIGIGPALIAAGLCGLGAQAIVLFGGAGRAAAA
ncbi:MFS transporter [Rhodobacterales bacterium HKCCE3408]|nr:MFS transporter [Rhodobacterales bacterium HKCCE3408]